AVAYACEQAIASGGTVVVPGP
ncbi:MAG: hypothetical protein QOH15_2263, partial [Gaiellales bacterium]|nr:hypothetical protein [Gaiellales bacterium]